MEGVGERRAVVAKERRTAAKDIIGAAGTETIEYAPSCRGTKKCRETPWPAEAGIRERRTRPQVAEAMR